MSLFRAWWYRLFRDPGPYPSEAAEAPDPVDSAAGHAIQVIRPAAVKSSTGEEAQSACAAHLKVCAMNDTRVALALAVMARGELADLWSAPARFEPFYVGPEVEW